jgi:DNA invertase Pin-like site-specific DNA recombinase
VYREKISGAAGRRQQLEKLLRLISEGDVVLMTRLDRLARSTRDLLNILDKIGTAGAQFKSLRETWADTTTPVGKQMITIIGGIAEFERELIRARTGDGIRRAKAAGVQMGEPPKPTKHQHREVLARLNRGETLTDIARSYAVSHMTISRIRRSTQRPSGRRAGSCPSLPRPMMTGGFKTWARGFRRGARSIGMQDKKNRRRCFDLKADMEALAKTLSDVRLIIIDPVSAGRRIGWE